MTFVVFAVVVVVMSYTFRWCGGSGSVEWWQWLWQSLTFNSSL